MAVQKPGRHTRLQRLFHLGREFGPDLLPGRPGEKIPHARHHRVRRKVALVVHQVRNVAVGQDGPSLDQSQMQTRA